MDVQPDFRDLLACFLKRGVESIIVGAFAVAHHGRPRNTGDLDLLVRPTRENARKILDALADFGFASLNLKEDDFTAPGQVIQLGRSPVRIDLLTSITGVGWEDADQGKSEGRYGDIAVSFLGLAQLRANKRATGRTKDLADLESLESPGA